MNIDQTYQYYFKNKAGWYYYVDSLDSVQVTQTKTPLVAAPKGWADLLAGIYHNKKYRGNFKKVSSSLQFVRDGKRILDSIATYDGWQGYLAIEIHLLNPEDYNHQLMLDGTIDFKSYEFGEYTSTAAIRESSLIDILDTNDDVPVDIPLTADNSGVIQLDGINLQYKTEFLVNDGTPIPSSSTWNTGRHVAEFVSTINENPYSRDTVRTKYNSHPVDVSGTGQPFFDSDINSILYIDYDFYVNAAWAASGTAPGPTSALRFDVLRQQSDGQYFNNIIYSAIGQDDVFSVSYNSGKRHHIVGSLQINVKTADKLFLCCNPSGMVGNAQAAIFTYEGDGKFNIRTIQRAKPTRHRFIKPWRLWQELVTRITNGEYSGISPYLQANDNLVLIPGTALRRETEPKIQTTVKDFLKYCHVNHLAGMVEIAGKNGEIKHLQTTYQPGISMSLSLVKDFRWRFNNEKMITKIPVGYPNQDFGVDGQINGKDEWNQTNNFTTGNGDGSGLDNNNGEFDLVSPYIASMYAQELMRVNFGDRRSVDNKGDNKVYLVDAEAGATVLLHEGSIQTIATNTIRVPGVLDTIAPGTSIQITNAGPNNGTYTVVNVSYLVVSYTTITVSQSVFNASFAGVIQYYDANVYRPRRPAYAVITGIQDPPTSYNTAISPKNLLKLHSPEIAAGVYNAATNPALGVIKFRSGDKNVKLSTSYDGVNFTTENADESLSSLPGPWVLPIEFEFSTDYVNDAFILLSGQKKYQQIEFNWMVNGSIITLYGYPLDVMTNPDNGKQLTWKLEASVNANMINLLP